MRDSNHTTIDLSANIADFFGGVVNEAIRARDYETTDASTAYLIGLLVDYTRPGQLGEETLSRPLTLLLDQALQAEGHERFERLRTVGDGVLYVSGFFWEHLAQRGVETRYVSTLGACAYENAAAMLRHGVAEASAPDLFRELAEKFRMFVSLIGDVADVLRARSANNDRAMVRLYERWLKTGSAPLAEALTHRGLVPVRGSGMVH
jgi:hypothetical protein